MFGSRAPLTSGTALGSGTTSVPYSQSVGGLSGGTTYYYCAIVSSSEGTAFGSVRSFTTAGPPVVTTSAASGLSASGATLNGSGTPNGAATTGWFRYDTSSPAACNDAFGLRAPSSSGTALGSGTSSVPYAQSVGGLLPGTKYSYCAIAQNAYGLAYGELQSFTTPALAPTVNTGSASATSGTGATLQATANPNGDATTGWFRYAPASPGTCNDTFGTKVGGSALGAGTSYSAFSQAVTGLTPATTYYYCALGSNALGLSVGTVRSFTTPSAPTATTEAASSFTASSAVLNGTGTPNRAATTGWFRYTITPPSSADAARSPR